MKSEKKYINLISLINSTPDNDLKAMMIRPLQDIEKLCWHFKNHGPSNIEFEILENPRKLHPEVNIAIEYPRMGDIYIGISQLCCGACDIILNEFSYRHRGCHGLCFPDQWVSPARLYDDLMQKLYERRTSDV